MAATLNTSALHDHYVLSDAGIVIDDTRVDYTTITNDYILSNIDRRSQAVRQRMRRINYGIVSDGTKMANSNRVDLGLNDYVVPDSGPFADINLTDEGGIRGYPSILGVGDVIVEWHLLSVTRKFLNVSDVVVQS